MKLNEIKTTQIEISAKDGYPLTSLLLEPKDTNSKAIIQFHSGTVTKKEYYLKLAKHLAGNGYTIILFDYRGVGESKPKKLKGFNASIADWGSLDAEGVSHWIQEKYPNQKVHLLAHSMGGQIYGMMENWDLFDKIILLSTSSGNYNNFANKWKIKLPTNLIFPIVIPLFGYVPGFLGLGEDWPKGVAIDWMTNSRQNGLMKDYLSNKADRSFYTNIDKKITAWFFPDDHMSTPVTMPNLPLTYPNADITTKVISPADVDLKSIGHFGLFKEKATLKLWPMLLDEFE